MPNVTPGTSSPERRGDPRAHLLGVADRHSEAQVRVYQRQAEVALARADLAHREAALNEALADMNSVVTSLLLNATGERLSGTGGG